MKLFLDTASIDEIRTVAAWGVLGGVTTNPSLVAKEAEDPDAVWKTILTEVEGDVSLEVTATGVEAMEAQGRSLAQMGPNAVVKLPMTPDGLSAATLLGADGIRVNITLVFSAAQAILAAEAGAYCVSPFLGRLDDAGSDGMGVLRTICDLYAVQGYQSKVLAASLRHPMHVVEAGLAGADIATMPFEVFTKLVKHPLTDIGLERFQADWDRLQAELGRRDTGMEG
jgi:transaldolase